MPRRSFSRPWTARRADERLALSRRGLRRATRRLRRASRSCCGHIEDAGSFPGAAAPSRTTPPSTSRSREGPGTIIGPYKLLEQIGEGGFGLVFMAEQQQPVRRKVALKILKPGMDTRQVIARFEAERQALALMDHPNIARVLDAGETGSGRPYFVMELVKGVPITDYCDQNRLTTRERLELFTHVCQAVQHAHHKGIIHRDIKPSNVMVTLHDGVPVVKVIDFGIAKALGQQLTDKTLLHRLRADGRHAAVHESRAGGAERPGHRHAQRHLLAGRAPVRAADGDDAVRQGAAAARRATTRCGGSSGKRSRPGRARV